MTRVEKTSLATLITLSAAASVGAASESQAARRSNADQYALGYFLPKTKMAAGFSQRLVRCPTTADPTILVETRANIVTKTVPDYSRLYRIDASAGFLAKRTTDLGLNPDGTMKSINASVEGQGSAVIAATAKLAAFAIPLAAGGAKGTGTRGVPPPRKLSTRCRPTVADMVDRRNELADTISKFEVRSADSTLSTADSEELAGLRDRLSALDDALTLSSDPIAINPQNDGSAGAAALDYDDWFDPMNRLDLAKLPGDDGVLVSWKINAAAQTALRAAAYVGPDQEAGLPLAPEAAIYYRRPVPIAISMVPCTSSGIKKHAKKPEARIIDGVGDVPCIVDKTPEAAPLNSDAAAGVLQLSGLFRLPIGRGSLFGSRTVAAEFDPSGAPVTLKYGSDPGAADIAAAIDAAREAGTTLRDARADALSRKAALLKSRKDIQDLEAALNTQP